MPRFSEHQPHIDLRSLRRGHFSSAGSRKGVAAVEVAVLFPLFVLLMAGAIDVGRALMVQHTLVESARAGCRLYCISDELTETDVRAVIDKVMEDASLEGYDVGFDPASSASIDRNSPVTVSVSIPYGRVTWTHYWFLSDRTLTGTCIMPGE